MRLFESESEVAQSCPTLWDPMDCSLPGSSVHGIFQARILEWVAISFSRGSSRPRDRTPVSHIVGRRFYHLSHQGSLYETMSTQFRNWEQKCMGIYKHSLVARRAQCAVCLRQYVFYRIGTPDRVLTWFYYASVPYSLLPMSLFMLLSLFYRGPFFSLFVVDPAVQILA